MFSMLTFIFPKAEDPGPGIVHFTDIGGNRPANREL
jgi:hypothetical protein